MLLLLNSEFLSFLSELLWKGYLMFQVLLGIGLLIFIHELGHFLAAKYYGVRVEVFSLGFGAPIQLGKWRLSTYRGDTEYRIAVIPFGGYVKMAGDWPEDETYGMEDEFNSKPVYQRMVIMSAGVVMNVILSVVLFIFAYYIGVQFHAPQVGGVLPGMPAWKAQIQPGDKIVEIDGQKIVTFDEIIPIIAFSDKSISVKIQRKDPESQKVIEKVVKVDPEYDEKLGFRAIGIRQSYQEEGKVVKGLAAYKAGLRTEDKIISINGEPASSNRDLVKYTRDVLNPKPIQIKVKRDGKEKDIEIHPKTSSYFVGVVMSQRFIKATRNTATPYLKAGDEILLVDGEKRHLFEKIAEYAKSLDLKQHPNISFDILREGKEQKISIPTEVLRESSFYDDIAFEGNVTSIGEVIEGKPASAAGLQVGDKVVQINKRPIDSFGDMSDMIIQSKGEALEFSVQRGKETVDLSVTPEKRYLFELGIAVDPKLLDQPLRCETFIDAIALGFKQTKDMGQHVVLMLISLFTRQVHPSNLGGPVTIFQASYNFAQFGFGRMIHWLALISINLAIINILPIPVLDGGHLLFLFFEKLKGSPINPKMMMIFQYIGLVFILVLMVYVTFNDISRLFDFLE